MSEPNAVSVGWLLEQEELGLRLRGGRAGLGRAIRWAHCIELPDPTPWLRGGELVLTTGLALPHTRDGQRRYLERLDAAGITAVAFGVGLSHRRMPPAMIEVADGLGLPLLEVPYATPFEAVTTVVLERLAERRFARVARAAGLQTRMTRAALRAGPAAVVRELALATGGRALLLDADHAVTAAHPVAGQEADDLRERLPTLGAASLADAGPDGVTTVDAIRVGRRLYGHLALITPQPLAQIERVLFSHAVSLIALAHELPARHAARDRLVEETVVALLTGVVEPADIAAEHLAGASMIRVLVARPAPLDRARDRVERELAADDTPALLRAVGDELIVVLPGDRDAARLARGLYAGLSGPQPPTAGAAALAEARTALSVAEARRKPLVAFDELAGAALLATPTTRDVVARLAEARLAPLEAYDCANRTDLVGTLRVFLEHHGQWEAAAAAIGVHRHTLRNRITRAAGLLGCDLDDAHVRAELLLSLTARSA